MCSYRNNTFINIRFRKLLILCTFFFCRTPVQTLFDAHPDVGVACMAMTPDAKYLVTIGASPAQVSQGRWFKPSLKFYVLLDVGVACIAITPVVMMVCLLHM